MRLCRNLCRPYGTRFFFPLNPALLPLRGMRAGLDYSAPTALCFSLICSTLQPRGWSCAEWRWGARRGLSKAKRLRPAFPAGLDYPTTPRSQSCPLIVQCERKTAAIAAPWRATELSVTYTVKICCCLLRRVVLRAMPHLLFMLRPVRVGS